MASIRVVRYALAPVFRAPYVTRLSASSQASTVFRRFQSNTLTNGPKAGEESVSAAIDNDHRYLNGCYDKVKNATTSDAKAQWRNQLTWVLARHSISEELTVYPAFEKYLGDEGHKMAEEDREQHQRVKEDLYEVQSMDPEDSRFLPMIDRLMSDLNTHIEKEMHDDMPKLEGAISRADSATIARSFQRTKMITPTRSHPAAPNTPFLESVAGLMTAPLDRLRDWMRTFPDDVPPEETHPVDATPGDKHARGERDIVAKDAVSRVAAGRAPTTGEAR